MRLEYALSLTLLYFHSLLQAVLGERMRCLYENSTAYLPVNSLVNLVGTDDYSLTLVNSKSSPNIRITMEKLYQEHTSISFTNESFVDSFGFRLGEQSSNNYQIVLTNKMIYLYNLTSIQGSSSLVLRLINKWSVNSLVNNFQVNSTTTAVQTDTHSAEFMMILVGGTDNVNQKFFGVRLNCPGINGVINCTLVPTVNTTITSLIFYYINNPMDGIRCNSTLLFLSLSKGNSSVEENAAGVPYYFARFCKFSQLPYDQRPKFFGSVQIFYKSANNTLSKTNDLKLVYTNETSYLLQTVNLAQFGNMIVLFGTNITFVIPLASLDSSSANASQWYPNANPEQLFTGQVDCQQNDYYVLSCYQSMYSLIELQKHEARMQTGRIMTTS